MFADLCGAENDEPLNEDDPIEDPTDELYIELLGADGASA
jgi:hypothetical protein